MQPRTETRRAVLTDDHRPSNESMASRLPGAGNGTPVGRAGPVGGARAASDAPYATAEVFDFTAMAAAGPVIEADPSGTAATVRVTTSIDAVCAVAFGASQTLGRLATDQDMAAALHSDHQVLLGGLEPDTEYFYRLQGVGVALARPISTTGVAAAGWLAAALPLVITGLGGRAGRLSRWPGVLLIATYIAYVVVLYT